MNSPPPHDEIAPDRAEIAARVFLATIVKEQQRYLATSCAAAERLAAAGSQHLHIAQMHDSVTRQVFDAQSSMFGRRIETDRAARAIEATAEAEAAANLTAVLEAVEQDRLLDIQPSMWTCSPLSTEDGRHAGHSSGSVDPARRSRPIVGAGATLDDLERAVNESLQPTESVQESAHDALLALLADWLQAEEDENRAALDDAQARAAMVRHTADVEAAEMFASARQGVGRGIVRIDRGPLPDEVAAGLHAAESGMGLHSALASLAESLKQGMGLRGSST